MKKYTVLKPTVTYKENKLLINGDVIYIEESIKTNTCGNKYTERKVYSSKTREYLGDLKSEDNLKLDRDYGTA